MILISDSESFDMGTSVGKLYVLATDHIEVSNVLVGIKLLVIMNFIFIGSPTATHAMMDAGYETGVAHWKRGDRI